MNKIRVFLVGVLLTVNVISADQNDPTVVVTMAQDGKMHFHALAVCKAMYAHIKPIAIVGAAHAKIFAKDIVAHPKAYLPSAHTVTHYAHRVKTTVVAGATACKDLAKAYPKETAVGVTAAVAGASAYKAVKVFFDKNARWTPTFIQVAVGAVAGFYAAQLAAKAAKSSYDSFLTDAKKA